MPVLVGTGIVIVALFALAAMHALLISGQRRLDDVRRETAAEAEEVRRLRLQVAELEAPDRVLEAARARLGMLDPGEVGYLLPVGVPTDRTEPIRVEAAEPPPPPTTSEPSADESEAAAEGAEETASAEQEEVDAVLSDGEEPSADEEAADVEATAPPDEVPTEGGPASMEAEG